ncbi:MAG: hypothetical protein IIX48_11000 [Lachnospiraceae bacterium]|nr:hypothetical protein [Lachnospiraceae bacterium]
MKKSKSIICLLACLVLLLKGCVFGVDNAETPTFQNISSENADIETSDEEMSDEEISSEAISDDKTLEQNVTLKEHVSKLLSEEKEENSAIIEENKDEEPTTDEYDEKGYCYSQLSEEEKTVYNEVYHGVTERLEVSVSTLSAEFLDKVFNCVLYDHPELFYLDGYQYTTRSRDDVTVSLSFKANYIYDEEETKEYQQKLDGEIEALLLSAPMHGSDYDKIKYVFDTIITNTDYVMNCVDNQNILSVFLYHQSVCNGYAKATQLLLNRLGIESVVVNGTADGESHAWNLVKADGAWYYLDTTWGDADFKDNRYQEVNPINYDYFMVDSQSLSKTHTVDRLVALPDCVARECNYYIHENLYLNGLDPEQIGDIFARGYDSGAQVVQFKCANDAVYDEIYNYLVDEQHAFDYLDVDNHITYVADDDANTFCFWLFN